MRPNTELPTVRAEVVVMGEPTTRDCEVLTVHFARRRMRVRFTRVDGGNRVDTQDIDAAPFFAKYGFATSP